MARVLLYPKQVTRTTNEVDATEQRTTSVTLLFMPARSAKSEVAVTTWNWKIGRACFLHIYSRLSIELYMSKFEREIL